MATKKRGLGQGIDSLIPNKVNANKETETVKVNAGSEKNETDGIFVNINKVEPNREQKSFILWVHLQTGQMDMR